MQRATLLNLAAIATLGAPLFGRGQKRRLPRTAALCAVAALAALAVLIAAAWHSPAHADGGASARNKTPASASNQTRATIQAHAHRILRALSDDDTNIRVRYWQARADCDAVAGNAAPAAPLDRFLLALTSSICAQLEARFGVNPDFAPPPGGERGAGLMLNKPDAAAGYTLFAAVSAQSVYLIDPLGRVAHTWHIKDNVPDRGIFHVKLLDNGNLMVIAHYPRTIWEVDPRGNILWQYETHPSHHDVLKMPNGNVLLLVRGRKSREEVIAAGGNPEFVHESGIDCDYLVEVRPTGASGGEVVWEWSVWDHLVQDFDPSKPNYGVVSEHPELIDLNFLLRTISERSLGSSRDWLHANTVDYNPELDQIILSPRNFSELWIIDRSATMEEARGHSGGNGGIGGDLLYRWGNPRAYRHGTTDDQRLFWQHQTHWIPPGLPGAGNILLFNNGNEFSGYQRFYSSIDEIAPPVEGYRYRRDANSPYPPAKLAWTYVAETPSDIYARVFSGAQRLPNGNTLIAYGTAGTIFQVTPDGGTAWKYTVPRHYHILLRQDEGSPARLTYGTPDDHPPTQVITDTVYRAYWYPPDYAGLQALDLTPGAYLEDTPDLLEWTRAALTAGDFGHPLARSRYDIYIDKNILIYFKQPCSKKDTQEKFFLHVFPKDASDLPVRRKKHGFDNRNFNYLGFDVHALDDSCIALALLPDYQVARIVTGQFTDEGRVWQVDIELGE